MLTKIQPTNQQPVSLRSEETNEGRLSTGRTVKPLLLNSKEKGGVCCAPMGGSLPGWVGLVLCQA